MKVYISGPIGGRPNGNREAFQESAEFLRGLGYTVVNPHEVSHDHDGPCARGKSTGRDGDPHQYGCYLLADMRELAQCEAIWLLSDWRHSPGARAEVEFAKASGIPQLCMRCLEQSHDWLDGPDRHPDG